MRFGRVVFFRRKIGGDLERQNPPIVIMPQDRFVPRADLAADQFACRCDLPMREVERLRIAKLQWSRKIDREIIAHLILREGCAVPIGDLAARSGNIENVGTRESWSLNCWNNFFIKRGRGWLRRGRGAGSCRGGCRCQLLSRCTGEREEQQG